MRGSVDRRGRGGARRHVAEKRDAATTYRGDRNSGSVKMQGRNAHRQVARRRGATAEIGRTKRFRAECYRFGGSCLRT